MAGEQTQTSNTFNMGKMVNHRYVIESFDVLLPDSEPVKISGDFITGLSIEKDYDNLFFPIFKVDVSVDPKLYYKIIENKLNVRFRVRLQYYNAKSTNQIKRDIINDIFCLYLDDNSLFIDKEIYAETKKVEGEGKTPRDISNVMSLYLFNEKHMTSSKTMINNVITSSTMTDALTFLFNSAGISKVLLSPLNNVSVYKEILLPYMPFLGQVRYLEEYFGFYNNGSILFFDSDATYMIDKNILCTAWRQLEYKQTILVVRKPTNSYIQETGNYSNDLEQRYYFNLNPSSVFMYNESVVNDHIKGNKMLTMYPKLASTNNINPDTLQRGSGTYTYKINKFNNKYTDSAEKITVEELSNVIYQNLSDFDMNSLTPNKEFIYKFEDPNFAKYNRSYRLSHVIYNFTKNAGELNISAECKFKTYGK